MCVKLNSLLNSEMRVCYVTKVFKQGINIKTMCPNYTLEIRNTQSHVLQVYHGAWVKVETVIENHVCYIASHCYYSFQALSNPIGNIFHLHFISNEHPRYSFGYTANVNALAMDFVECLRGEIIIV